MRLCHLAINIEFVTPLFLRRQIHFKYVLRKLFATFTHFSYVAILLSKLLVLLCKSEQMSCLCHLFLHRQIQSSMFYANFLQRLRIFRTLQFYCRNCLCVCANFAKVLCVGKTKRRKGFLFCGANCFNFFATVLKFCYRLPDAGHIVCQSSAPASISILSLGEVGLLSPCLTNIIVTKDSTTNTVA